MSAATKKPPSAPSDSRMILKESSIASPNRNPIRSLSTPNTTAIVNNVARTRSFRGAAIGSARASTQWPSVGTVKANAAVVNSEADEEARNANIALLDDLKDRLRKSEESSEEFKKQIQILQMRFDEATKDQGKLEEKVHESEERIEILENEKREAIRLKREIEAIYEAEKVSVTKEREDASTREEEMQEIIQRLKDNLNSRMNGDEEGRSARRSQNTSPNLDGQFAPPSNVNRSDSINNSKLLLQKDRLIESLRMELAESQIKIVESENIGGGRFQAIEKQLLEARMANAKLLEENESYQVLLSEKTLNGDFSKSEIMGFTAHNADALNALEGRTELTSLADELSEADGSLNDNCRKLEAELKVHKEQNKALTVYINKIIERLLKHQDFEAILDKSSDLRPSTNGLEKDLPPPPKETSGTSVLQRAKTVGVSATRRPRPQSFMPASGQSLVSDLGTAPSIPFNLNRNNNIRISRPHSEQFTGGTAGVVSQMLRVAPLSPPLNGPQTPRQTSTNFVPPPTPVGNMNGFQRNPSFGQTSTSSSFPGMISETSSTSGDSGEVNTPPSNSPPRLEKATTFAGNKPRPLRLLRENNSETGRRAEEAAAKLAKRSSWMGWAFGKKDEVHPEDIPKE